MANVGACRNTQTNPWLQVLVLITRAAVRNSEGISDIFDCLIGLKQGCPLSATLFGLFVDGLEQHLMDTTGHNAPSLSGVLIPLLLYADDLIIMSTTAARLQRQLDALQQFCHQGN